MGSRLFFQTTIARIITVGAFVFALGQVALAQDSPDAVHTVVQRSADGGLLEALMFYIVAGILVGSGLAICLSKNIVRMAIYLFGTLSSAALLYFLLMANFIGAIQLIVYAGGTLVLLIFGVMLTSKSPWVRFDIRRSEMIFAAAVCVVLGGVLIWAVSGASWPVSHDVVTSPTVATFGRTLLTTYLVPFEVISVVLLVVMIGAAYMARQE